MEGVVTGAVRPVLLVPQWATAAFVVAVQSADPPAKAATAGVLKAALGRVDNPDGISSLTARNGKAECECEREPASSSPR